VFADVIFCLALNHYFSKIIPAEYNDAATEKRILKYIGEKGSVTALDLVKLDHVSILIAKEQLATAEQSGAICRDETLEGIRYFDNVIKTFKFSLK